MCVVKDTLHILVITPALPLFFSFPALRRGEHACRERRRRTSACAGGGVEVVLVGTAVVLALPEQQNSAGVTARRAEPGRVAGQALAVAG